VARKGRKPPYMTFHLHSRHVGSIAARSGTKIVAKEELVACPRLSAL
jgi:hypothetical protein